MEGIRVSDEWLDLMVFKILSESLWFYDFNNDEIITSQNIPFCGLFTADGEWDVNETAISKKGG